MAQPHTVRAGRGNARIHQPTTQTPLGALTAQPLHRALAANLVSKKPGDEQLLFSLEVFMLRLQLCSARAKGEPRASDGADTALIQGASQGL